MVARGLSNEIEFFSKVSSDSGKIAHNASVPGSQRYQSGVSQELSSPIEPRVSKRQSSSTGTSSSSTSLGSSSWTTTQTSFLGTKKQVIDDKRHFSVANNEKYYSSSHPKQFSSSNVPEIVPSQTVPNITLSTVSSPVSEFPLFAIIICAILLTTTMSVIVYFLCNCIYKRKKRRNQLATMTPKASDPRMAGVRADQPIQFVVPTTIVINETTEDSLSDTDYSSGGPRQLPILVDRRRKRPLSSGFHINPEDLQRGLYEGVATKLGSSTFFGHRGKIGFSLHYNTEKNHLYVKIIGATNLPCLFLKTTGNPCVKVVMMPDRIPKFITKVQRNTLNPLFNEIFMFPVMKSDLNSKKLKMSVWDYDKFSRKLLIGQVIYAIKDSELTNSLNVDSTTGDIWIDLKHNVDDIDTHKKGNTELLFSLCYNPEISSLTVCILKVRGLDIGEKEKETCVYVKVTLYVRRKMTKTKKTSSKRKIPVIEFSSSFTIHVPPSSINEVDLLVTVCDKSTGLGSKKLIGQTHVGSHCLTDQGLQHWQDMLLSPKSTCAQWHILGGL